MTDSLKSSLGAWQRAGIVAVRGRDGLELLHRLSTQDLLPLRESFQSRQAVFVTPKGKMIDWVDVLPLLDQSLLLRTSSGRAETLCRWISKYTITEDVDTQDVTSCWKHFSLWGPGFEAAPERAFLDALGCLPFASHPAFGGSVEMLVPVGKESDLLEHLISRGVHWVEDVVQLDRRRILAGVPSPHFEFEEPINPLELRLLSAISFDAGCYVGQEVISRLDSYDKVARLLMGFRVARSQQRQRISVGSKLKRGDDPIGRVTSAVPLEAGGHVGLALVKRDAATSGPAQLDVDGAEVVVQLEPRPFWL